MKELAIHCHLYVEMETGSKEEIERILTDIFAIMNNADISLQIHDHEVEED